MLHWLESVQGLPTRAQLGGFATLVTGYESFKCGPAPYMAVVKKALSEAGVPRERIHLEVFESLTGDPFSDVPYSLPRRQLRIVRCHGGRRRGGHG